MLTHVGGYLKDQSRGQSRQALSLLAFSARAPGQDWVQYGVLVGRVSSFLKEGRKVIHQRESFE